MSTSSGDVMYLWSCLSSGRKLFGWRDEAVVEFNSEWGRFLNTRLRSKRGASHSSYIVKGDASEAVTSDLDGEDGSWDSRSDWK